MQAREQEALPTKYLSPNARRALRLVGGGLIVVPIVLLYILGAAFSGKPNGIAHLLLFFALLVGTAVSASFGMYLVRKSKRFAWEPEVQVEGLVLQLEHRDRHRDQALAPGSKSAGLSAPDRAEAHGRLSSTPLAGELSAPESDPEPPE